MATQFLSFLLVAGTLLTGLVAGLLFAFALLTMPGLATLRDREFVRAFAAIDAIIQRNNLLFILTWAGSAVSLIIASVIGFSQLDGVLRLLLLAATAAYVAGVQVPTIAVNVPLNNALQRVDADGADDKSVQLARAQFEPRWVRWNVARTIVSIAVTATLLVVLLFL